jgi:hypothetical protein
MTMTDELCRFSGFKTETNWVVMGGSAAVMGGNGKPD